MRVRGEACKKCLKNLCNLVPLRALNLVKKMHVQLGLPAAGENFENLRFFFEFGALFQQSGKITGAGACPLSPQLRNYGSGKSTNRNYTTRNIFVKCFEH